MAQISVFRNLDRFEKTKESVFEMKFCALITMISYWNNNVSRTQNCQDGYAIKPISERLSEVDCNEKPPENDFNRTIQRCFQ
jgi:hypothetical protein